MRYKPEYDKILTREVLEQKYIKERKSIRLIAQEVGINFDTVHSRIRHKYKLDRFPIRKFYNKVLTKKFLEQHFVKENKTAMMIAEELNEQYPDVTFKYDTIMQYVRHYKLPISKNKKFRRGRLGKGGRWKGYEDLSGTYMNSAKRHAIKRKLEFAVDAKFLWELYIKQEKRCALSGLEITFPKIVSKKRCREQTASLDRIDSTKGYTPDNVQWIHKRLQTMKWDMPDDEFIAYCVKIADYRGMKISA